MANIKRCIISKEGQFRVSNPGVDVSSTNTFDFMMHEEFLFAQPYFFTFVDCPFAGYSGKDSKSQTVDVAVPDVNADPTIILFPATNDSRNTYPFPRGRGSGSSTTTYDVNFWMVFAQPISSTQIRVWFNKDADGKRSPDGCYLVLARKS